MAHNIFFVTFYLMLPVYFANMAPLLFKDLYLLDFLAKPLDFGKRFQGKRILGPHKTWRGLVVGVIFAIIIAYAQYKLQDTVLFRELSIFSYENWFLIGFLLGFGALFGDAVKSFFKRRKGIRSGDPYIPWDQLDYTIGSLVFLSIIFVPPVQLVIAALILNFGLHIAANHLGYYLGLNDVKW